MQPVDRPYRHARRALWGAGLVAALTSLALAAVVPGWVHADPSMVSWVAWTVHLGGAALVVLPGLTLLGVSGWAAAQLTGRLPQTTPAKAALVLFALAGLWPLAAWVGWGLWRARRV